MSLINVTNAIDGSSCVKLDQGDVVVCYIHCNARRMTPAQHKTTINNDQRDLIDCYISDLRATRHAY